MKILKFMWSVIFGKEAVVIKKRHPHASPTPHDRKGHWRTTKNGKLIWVNPTSVCKEKS
jgi:hypothetical protein